MPIMTPLIGIVKLGERRDEERRVFWKARSGGSAFLGDLAPSPEGSLARSAAEVSSDGFEIRCQIALRMRSAAHVPLFADERTILLYRERERARAFLGQRPTFDAVEMQDPCVSGETREDC